METHQRSSERYHPRLPTASPFSRFGVCNLAIPLISGTGKTTDFKFGGYIYRANLNKSPLKTFGENGAWARLPKFFWVPPIIAGMDKATDFKFCRNIHRVDPNKSPWKMSGIVAVVVVRESRKFSRHPCIALHVKATDFYILKLHFTLYGLVRTLQVFNGLLHALRGHFCDSTAFLFYLWSLLKHMPLDIDSSTIGKLISQVVDFLVCTSTALKII